MEMEKIIKRYNDIMYDLANDHLTIGTFGSENLEGEPRKEEWTLRDMVSECQYQLDLHLEGGTIYSEQRYSDHPEERKLWRREVGRLTRFINRYKDSIGDMKCVTRHCSKWDN